jgi:hypothetical protein
MKSIFTLFFALMVSIGCYAQKNETLAAGIPTGSHSFAIEKAYPNPVKDFVNIELQAEESGDLQISLVNILGTEVKKWDNFYLNTGYQKIQIDLSQFKNGVYILRITKNGLTKTQVLKKS